MDPKVTVESQSERDGRGIDRRTMIKRAAVAGAAAWTAPMILDSLASPAAAATVSPGCFQMLYTVSSNSCEDGPTVNGSGCSSNGAGSKCASPSATIPADVSACLSQTAPSTCGTSHTNAGDPIQFSVGSGCSCTIVYASGRRTSSVGAQCDTSATITGGGTVVTFDGTGFLPGFAEWDRFEIWLSCT